MNIADWLDGGDPHDPARSLQQLTWLQEWANRATRRVLDLGCGEGRALVALARAGHEVVGIDTNASALATCRERLGELDAELVEADFTAPWPQLQGHFDAILCMGNTFMLVHDPKEAAALLRQCAAHLASDGLLVIDDIPGEFLPELESGNWTDGVSEDGALQMIWAEDQEVFTIRTGSAIDETDWSFRHDDVLLRLWTDPSIAHVASAAGLSGPIRPESTPGAGAVLVMQPVPAT